MPQKWEWVVTVQRGLGPDEPLRGVFFAASAAGAFEAALSFATKECKELRWDTARLYAEGDPVPFGLDPLSRVSDLLQNFEKPTIVAAKTRIVYAARTEHEAVISGPYELTSNDHRPRIVFKRNQIA